MTPHKLPLRNLLRRPGRTAALTVLVVFLALSLFAGSVIVMSLNSGLGSLENRLGADLIVVPATARGKVDPEKIWLQGTTGYYYMSASKLEEIRGMQGVAQASAQVYLASLRADCCSMPIQVIGFDPETDFTIRPWIGERLKADLGPLEVVVGSRVSAGVNETIRIYGESCLVIARLAPTGTGLDTAVYCTMDTMAALLQAARDLNHELKIDGDPARVVSAIYVKAVPGEADRLETAIRQTRNPKVTVIRARTVTSDVERSLGGVAHTITVLIVCVWILALILLTAAFLLLGGERRREFAALRALGMSRGGLAGIALKEALLVSLFGGLIGIGLALLFLLPFSGLIESALGLPFLQPGWQTMLILAAGTLLAVCAAGSMASVFSARRLSRVDISTIMREGA
ncbi:MAG: ABC transporter permease [Clostridia bacterium]|nr:ABC transporter permease [Clostridia bacterium]